MNLLIQAVLCGTMLCFLPSVQAEAVVHIKNSRIFGKTITVLNKQVKEFLGVRFAKPPLGQLRFLKPVPLDELPPVVTALTMPPTCLQFTEKPVPWYPNTTHKSEDCLYLNIWVPEDASRTNKKAVMYWMYGGSHRYGSITLPVYNGKALAAQGDIIVVTVNYRVGYFGFLTSNSQDAPGNQAIWDVLEGLRWVNKHIGAFGGDVSRITVAGESAGSINVGFFSISPLTKGLYARQIMESASPAYRRGDNNTQNLMYSQQIAKYTGCASDTYTIVDHPKEVVNCLRGVDADVLTRADFDLAPTSGFHLAPQFGDEILPNNPRIDVINGDFRCTDLLIGNNKDEGSYQLSAFLDPEYFGFFGEKDPHVNRSMGQDYIRTISALFPDPETIVNYYLPPNLTDDTDYRIRTQVYTAAGDTLLLCPTVYYAEKCAEQNKNVYYYFFTHRPSTSPWAPWQGTTHFDEVQFVFGLPTYKSEYEASESHLSMQMIDIWSSFVKNGSPNIPWPLYSKQQRTYKYLGPDSVTGANGENGPHSENCDFLKPSFGF